MSYSEAFLIGITALAAIFSTIATYMAIMERDLLKAVIFSAIQSTIYAFIYYMLMAPDIDLVYIPVAVGLYPAVIIALIKKTTREENP